MKPPVPSLSEIDAIPCFPLADCILAAGDEAGSPLAGFVVAMPPASPWRAATVHHLQVLLQGKLGAGVLVRVQAVFEAGPNLQAQPDVAVLPGRNGDYLDHHPFRAHLVVEVADRLEPGEAAARASVYARAGVAVCWVVSLADRSVETFRMPDRLARRYRQEAVARGSDRLPLDAYPEAWIEAREVLLEGAGR